MPSMTVVDGVTQMMPHSLSMPQEFSVVPPNAITWTLRHNLMHASYPPPSLEVFIIMILINWKTIFI